MICFPEGGILDDLIVYRLGEERFMVVANASNAAAVSDALAERLAGCRVVLDDRSLATALVAIQGPRAAGILAPLTDVALDGLRYYAIAEGHVAGVPALVARTGYTGEDGFEVFVDVAAAGDGLGRPARRPAGPTGVVPVGLGARDTLRLEAGHAALRQRARAGHDAVRGRPRPRRQARQGGRLRRPRRAREGRARTGPARSSSASSSAAAASPATATRSSPADRQTGAVTSGTLSPTLGEPIAMAYVTPSDAEPGTILDVGIRDQRVPAEVVPLPFYRRPA